MRRRPRLAARTAVGLALLTAASAQAPAPAPPELTLERAEALALSNDPDLAGAWLRAQAGNQVVQERRSAYLPASSANLTAVGADRGTAVSAGALNTSSLSSRAAGGFGLTQLVSDFGRTADLVYSARLQAAAGSSAALHTRAEVVVAVREAYFQAEAAVAVRQATQAALDNRRLSLRQIQALEQSQMKSTLDVEFAQVLVSEAELANSQADNRVRESWEGLAAVMGMEQSREYRLAPPPPPPPLPADPAPLLAQALAQRTDLKALELESHAAHAQADAEGKLGDPTLSAAGAVGLTPVHDPTVAHDTYAAAGLNLSIPVFNGGLFAARHAEAELNAQAADKAVQALQLRISRDVTDAWLEADTANRDLAVTDRLEHEADRALELAQARYDNGLGSIVELNQAQLNQTAAHIQAAGAEFDYLSKRALLDFATGAQP